MVSENTSYEPLMVKSKDQPHHLCHRTNAFCPGDLKEVLILIVKVECTGQLQLSGESRWIN